MRKIKSINIRFGNARKDLTNIINAELFSRSKIDVCHK